MSKRPVIVTVGFTSLIADPLSESEMGALLASRIADKPDAARVAEALDAHCRAIEGLTVHSVGADADSLIVYCYGSNSVRRRMPQEFKGHTVKYVICRVMP